MKNPLLSITAALLLAGIANHLLAEEEEGPKVDPKAKEIIERAIDYLADAKQFRVNAEIWQDIEVDSGEMAQFSKLAEIQLRRPDRLRIDVSTSVPKRSFYYDGASLTVLDRVTGFFASGKTPATIDETLKAAEEKFGITFPLEDLLLSRPFGDGASKAISGSYYGLEPVLGVMCHHVSFQSEVIDWQAWIEDGAVPLVRKAVIDFKTEQGSPRWMVLLNKWDLVTPLPDFVFQFDPPPGAVAIEFVKIEEEVTEE
ncbi:MAG TPA: DUF2092 domain-containing protein [Terrimicrobiaceae bacterium]